MKKSMESRGRLSVFGRRRPFKVAIFAIALLTVGMITAIAKYAARSESNAPAPQPQSVNKKPVTIEVAGRKLLVTAQTLQQGPLTQDQAQQLAAALKDNQSTDGLVQVPHADGTVSMDLQGRFQDVVLAKKADDGSLSQACVDNSEAAAAFLQTKQPTKQEDPGNVGKATVKEQ
jgi:hypothetical protein